MKAEEIISRLRKEIDKVYEQYEGEHLIEDCDLMQGFEDIINDYCEDKNYM